MHEQHERGRLRRRFGQGEDELAGFGDDPGGIRQLLRQAVRSLCETVFGVELAHDIGDYWPDAIRAAGSARGAIRSVGVDDGSVYRAMRSGERIFDRALGDKTSMNAGTNPPGNCFAWPGVSCGRGKLAKIGSSSSALLRGDGREGRNQLVDALASAMRTNHFRLFDVGDVVLLGEFLIAVFAMKNVLRHGLLRRT